MILNFSELQLINFVAQSRIIDYITQQYDSSTLQQIDSYSLHPK